jgi:flagellar protein FliO/FliZ
MMVEYFIRLFILLPLIGGLVWGSLWLWRRLQAGLPVRPMARRPVQLVDMVSLGNNGKIAVLEFAGQHLVLGVSRSGIVPITAAKAESKSDA